MFKISFDAKWETKGGSLGDNHVSKLKEAEVSEIVTKSLESLEFQYKSDKEKANPNRSDYKLLFDRRNRIYVMKGIHQKRNLHITLMTIRDNGKPVEFHLYLVQHEADDGDLAKTTFYYKEAYLSVSGNAQTETLPSGKRGTTNNCFHQERRHSISFDGHQTALATLATAATAPASSATTAATAAASSATAAASAASAAPV